MIHLSACARGVSARTAKEQFQIKANCESRINGCKLAINTCNKKSGDFYLSQQSGSKTSFQTKEDIGAQVPSASKLEPDKMMSDDRICDTQEQARQRKNGCAPPSHPLPSKSDAETPALEHTRGALC